MLGLCVIVFAWITKKSDKKSLVFLLPLALGLMLCSIDFYYMYQGELINQFYNGGSGVVYRQIQFDNLTNTTTAIDTQMYDWQDDRVGEYLGYNEAMHSSFEIVGIVSNALLIGLLLYIVYKVLIQLQMVNKIRWK